MQRQASHSRTNQCLELVGSTPTAPSSCPAHWPSEGSRLLTTTVSKIAGSPPEVPLVTARTTTVLAALRDPALKDALQATCVGVLVSEEPVAAKARAGRLLRMGTVFILDCLCRLLHP